MNLGPRCNKMLAGGQCPNTVVDGEQYCALHLQLETARDTMPTNTDKHINQNEQSK